MSPRNSVLFAVILLASSVLGLPVRREVPQEHSHEPILTSVRTSLQKNNPAGIVDPVFGLLGNAAAAGGAGTITDPDCLQQAIADQAFTNSKAEIDVQGQVNALIYRALERNTAKVGQASAACKSLKAANAEIAAIQQHQDPASTNAKAINKAITLELAKQIKAIGGNPLDALKAGTFAPGNLNDNTGKGNTCNDVNNKEGCIFTENLLVPDATPEEINAAVGGGGAGNPNNNAPQQGNENEAAPSGAPTAPTVTVTVTVTANPSATTSTSARRTSTVTVTVPPTPTRSATKTPAASATASATPKSPAAPKPSSAAPKPSSAAPKPSPAAPKPSPAAPKPSPAAPNPSPANPNPSPANPNSSPAAPKPTSPAPGNNGNSPNGNLQTFKGTLGGIAAPTVTTGGRGFLVEGNDSFLNQAAALGRSCDVQHNKCANLANSAAGRAAGLTVGQCDQQNNQCRALIAN